MPYTPPYHTVISMPNRRAWVSERVRVWLSFMCTDAGTQTSKFEIGMHTRTRVVVVSVTLCQKTSYDTLIHTGNAIHTHRMTEKKLNDWKIQSKRQWRLTNRSTNQNQSHMHIHAHIYHQISIHAHRSILNGFSCFSHLPSSHGGLAVCMRRVRTYVHVCLSIYMQRRPQTWL